MFSRPLALLGTCLLLGSGPALAEVGKAQQVAPGVWFHEGDLARRAHCNNGWIEFRDYVLVVDANFPSGAHEVLPKIRETTSKPVRFAFDTHHHGDHAYGNQVWVEQGATVVAHEGVLKEMQRHETGYFGGAPGRWEGEAKGRPDVAKSKLSPPTLLFPDRMAFDDGQRRVELIHFGVAHTRGDGFAWLPKDRILFTGDACVNGPYNNAGDGHIGDWIRTLESVRKLEPKVVCPGHGLVGGPELLDHQLAYFRTLRDEVKAFADSGATAAEVKGAVDRIRGRIQSNENTRNFLNGQFAFQVEKVWQELGGQPFPKGPDGK